MDAVPGAYHPSGADSAATQEGLNFPTNATTNHNTSTMEDHTGMILPADLGDAAAAAAAAAATAIDNPLNPAQHTPGTLDIDNSLQPSPSSLPMLSSPPSSRGGARGSSREPKSQKVTTEKLFCQVEDCQAPLEGLKDYHQRYKVCDVHLKLEYIEKDGLKVRFCQQCGRFQPLDEFDDMKRSCRARLQKHNLRRRKRARDAGDTNAAKAAAIGHHNPHDPAALAAIAAGFNAAEVATMQEAMQFASATLMQTTAAASAVNIATNNATNVAAMMQQPANVDVQAAAASASIAGMPFGGALQSMPFIPSKEVMTLLLKGYAGMFHYTIDNLTLKSRAPPTTPEELAAPMEAAAVAAAAAMTAAGIGGVVMPGDESAAAHLMAIQAQQAAEGGGGAGGGEYGDPSLAAAAAAAAAAANAVSGAAEMYNNPGSNNDGQGPHEQQQQHGDHVDINTLPPSV